MPGFAGGFVLCGALQFLLLTLTTETILELSIVALARTPMPNDVELFCGVGCSWLDALAWAGFGPKPFLSDKMGCRFSGPARSISVWL